MQLCEAHRIEVPMNEDKMKEETIVVLPPGEIPAGSIDAIAGGYCTDPFAILGPHSIPARDAWNVRAFLPQAEFAHVLLPNGDLVPMERRHKEGVFVATMPGRPARYRFQVQDWHGVTTVLDDP